MTGGLTEPRAVARASLARLRAHPRHLVLTWLVLGLLAGPRSVAAAMAVVLAAPLVAARATVALAMTAAAFGGAASVHVRDGGDSGSALRSKLGHVVSGEATLLEAPRRWRFGAFTAMARFRGERVLLRGYGKASWGSAPTGARVAVRGAVAAPDAFVRRRGAGVVVRASSIRRLPGGRGGVAGVIDRVRTRAQRALADNVPQAQGALLQGMVLGDDSRLPRDLAEDFKASGLSHLTAASGQNVMLLAALTTAAMIAFGLGLRARLAVVLVMIAGYVPLAGGGPSIVRAGVMGAAGVVAGMVGRPASRWYALGLAAAVTLAVDPRAADDPGWQMSFAAVAAILAGARPLRDRLAAHGIPPGLGEAVALTVAAGLATAPIIAWHFERVSLVAPAANVLAVPAIAPVMWLGMIAAAVGQVAAWAAAPVAAVAALPAGYITLLADTAADVPAASVHAPPLAVLAGAVAIAVAVWRRRRATGGRRGWAVALAAAVAAGAVVAWPSWNPWPAAPAAPSRLRITFLDVGQGDATLVQHGPIALLVDAGPTGAGVVGRLRAAGIRRLDAVVVTHAQADHDGGAPEVIDAMPVGLVVDGRDGRRPILGDELAAAAARRRIRLVAPYAGQVLRAGPVRVRVLWPRSEPAATPAGADPNARALVALVRAGGASALLTADVESDVLTSLDLPRVDVLKVAHHGSADTGLPALLDRLRPTVAVVSVGAGNPYGHPARATLAALEGRVPRVYRTDRDGSVQIDDKGGALLVRLHR